MLAGLLTSLTHAILVSDEFVSCGVDNAER